VSDEGRQVSEAIRISGARKVYEVFPGTKRVAVADVSIRVPEGAIHGLLGPNGAGKTTTLKMLLGLVRPTGGTFEVLGTDSRRRGGRVRLGFLPEQPYFPQQLSAQQALRLYARLSGVPQREIPARIDGLLDRVGLGGQERTKLSAFSRGMLQRIGIAQAVIASPRVVVLDEPASGLDPVGQRDIRNFMLSLKQDGVTVLLSSHQLSEVEAVCDRVSILDRGLVAAEGRIEELLQTAGRTSMRVTGLADGIPEHVRGLTQDLAVASGVFVFSVADTDVRRVVDAVDDVGGTLLSVAPKREALEDYFARLLERGGTEVQR
jgi:ABC-2 type transport system ATP-binding protein